ncbi:MAG: hypothetical protein H0X66_12845 [Verrucomicrobia bacterium]|nr:hypothetical protein [Verrucomicrobiota bacterium]
MKHLPFDSIFRSNFEVVEQRQGKVRFYPHTTQLPLLLRALNLEFYNSLPPRIARVDHRGSAFDKIVLRESALIFCGIINGARKDDVQLFFLPDRNLVTKLAIVQQVTEEDPRGVFHRFRFYAGENFFPEIYANGKRLAFSDHVLERFFSRTEYYEGEDLTSFLLTFYGSPIIAMPVGPGRAFVVSHDGSILAFPYKESANEYFVTSCLTINEIHSMQTELPPHTINLHYDLPFVRPQFRNWTPLEQMKEYFERWERKVKPDALVPMKPNEKPFTWHECACRGRDHKKFQGYGPGSQVIFTDYIAGPDVMEYKPNEGELCYDEIASYKKAFPDVDWDIVIAHREKEGTYAPATFGSETIETKS